MNAGCGLKATGTATRRLPIGAPNRITAAVRRENLNGGIIASLIDCHSLNLAIAHAYRAEGRPIGSAPRIGYVTANLQVTYAKPTPIDQLLELRARITKLKAAQGLGRIVRSAPRGKYERPEKC